MSKYLVTTYDPETGKFTPQEGVSPGPYELFELRHALRQLRKIGYDANRGDSSVLVEKEDEHTKGPWEIGTCGNCNVVHFDGDDIRGVAYATHKANARLIAAAPDLLAACEASLDNAVVSGLEEDGTTSKSWRLRPNIVSQLRAAIARATKRTND